MNEDVFNMQVRKLLKKVGITSQREIEKAVRAALDAGELRGDEQLDARVTLQVEAIGLDVAIQDRIALE